MRIAGGRPALVANIGTALTIDAVTAEGRHLGGAIAPGPSTMIASLLDGTHGIRRRAAGKRAGRVVRAWLVRARYRQRARRRGAYLRPRRSSIARCAKRGPRCGATPLLLLTGGAAGAAACHI